MSNLPESELTPLQRALVAIREMRARLKSVEDARHEPIAIIGAGCRFPGGINAPDELWTRLMEESDLVTPVPKTRWDVEELYEQYPNDEVRNSTGFGSFIDDIDQFDANSFGIAPREAVTIDPQQRLLLETAWEALENAGIAPFGLEATRTGVYIGISTNDYLLKFRDTVEHYGQINSYMGTGTTFSVAAGRIAYLLGINGPALAVDTACSSALVALHLACESLRSRQTDMALTGGVNLMLRADTSIYMMTMGALSPTARCRTFNADADGYVRGEGAGIVVLKRLSDAQRDGDNVLAVIRGTAINHDGRSSGLTVPSGRAQQDVIKAALADTGDLTVNDISYVEAHGTGTPLGDPIELRALTAVYGKNRTAPPLQLGSIKTNLGHLEAAAGIAGLLKVVLSLQNEALPKHLHFSDPSPHFDWKSAPLSVVEESRSWQSDENPLRAGLSSFGFSGTNAHVIIEQAPESEAATENAVDRPSHVVTLSAKTKPALSQLSQKYQTFLATSPDIALADIAHNSNVGRTHFEERLAIVAATKEELVDGLKSATVDESHPQLHTGVSYARGQKRVAFLFTGQGSQYTGMARTLYETQPTFKRVVDECAQLLAPHMETPLLNVLFAEEGDSRIDQTGFTQPALFVIEYALAKMWQGWGLQPTVLIGHSIGELVAACIAGIFSLEDGLRLAAKRGQLMQALPAGGAMLAVFADEATVNRYLTDFEDVGIAAINAPKSIVISGMGKAVATVQAKLESDKIRVQPLVVSHAFHSSLMNPMLEAFAAEAERISYSSPRMRIISTVSGTAAKGAEMANATYWKNQIRQPVRYADAAQALVDNNIDIAVECGPTPTLTALGRRTIPDAKLSWIVSLNRKKGDWESLLDSVAQLYVEGVDIDWSAFDADYGRNRVQLPTYTFDRQRHWVEPSESPQSRTQKAAGHPLLGSRLSSALKSAQFENQLTPLQYGNMSGKQLDAASLSPGITLSLALQALHELNQADVYTLKAFRMGSRGLSAGQSAVTQTVVTPMLGQQARVEIFARAPESDQWLPMAQAEAAVDTKVSFDAELATIQSRFGQPTSLTAWLATQNAANLDEARYSALIANMAQADGEWLVQFNELPAAGRFVQYPLFLDVGLQLLNESDAGDTHAGQISLLESVGAGRARWCHVHAATQTLQYFDADGRLIARASGITFEQEGDAASAGGSSWRNEWLYEMAWQEGPAVDMAAATSGNWLLVADEQTDLTALSAQFDHSGATITRVQAATLLADGSMALDELLAANSLNGVIWVADAHNSASSQHVGIESERQTGQLMLFAQQMAANCDQRRLATPPSLWVVTRSAVPFKADRIAANQSALWGLGRTLALELPRYWGGLIDLPDGVGQDSWQTVARLINSPEGEHEIVLRAGKPYVGRLVSLGENALASQELHCRADGAYLVTGGLGSLGLTVAKWLAERGARRLILLGRSPLPPRKNWYDIEPSHRFAAAIAAIRMLEASGVHVHLGSVDVANRDDLQTYLSNYEREGWPAIRGVVHAAGVLRDRAFAAMSLPELSAVMRPKAAGGWNLHELTLDKPLDFFVAFSSVAAVTGSVGQANYGAANEFLNGLMAQRQLDGLPGLSINWGPWDVGMAASAEVVARRERLGIGVISEPAGANLLTQLTATRQEAITVMPMAPNQWRTLYPENIRTFDALSTETVVAPAQAQDTVTTLLAASGDERQQLIADLLTDRISTVLRIDSSHLVAERNVMELGLDSIMVMELLEVLNRDLSMTLYARELFEQPSIRQLSTYLNDEFERTHGDGTAVSTATVTVADLVTDRQFSSTIAPDARVPNTVLLLSSPRAGSTLLRVMLQGHPELFCPPELHLLPFESMAQRDNELQGSYLSEGLQRALMALNNTSADDSHATLEAWTADDKPILDVYQALVDSTAPRLLIDKSPTYGLDINTLNRAEQMFEDAKYIHLVRHPYAVMDSFIKNRMDRLFGARAGDSLNIAEDIWTTVNSNIADFLEGVDPSKHHFVRYEELVVEPERVLRGLCAFLGVDFVPDMLNPYDGQRMTDGVHANSLGIGDPNFLKHRAIDPKLADAWRTAQLARRPSRAVRSLATEFEYETPWPLAAAAAPAPQRGDSSAPTARGDNEAPIQLSYAQKRLWFLDRMDPGSSSLNIHASVRIHGNIDRAALQSSLNTIIQRQESLRTRFGVEEGEPTQQILPLFELELETANVSHVVESKREAALEDALNAFNQAKFDLTKDVLIRVKLIEIAPQRSVLALVMHHIISDGWSLNLFFRELGAAYDAAIENRAPELPALPIQYGDYALWQSQWLDEEPRQKQLDYWRNQLAAPRQITELPADYRRPPIQMHVGDQLGLTMSAELTASVKRASREAGVTPFMFLLTAFKLLLFRHIGQEDITIGAPITGRERREVQGLIGFFLNSLILRTQIDDELDFPTLLERVKETTLGAYKHQDIPFEMLLNALHSERDMSRTPFFQIFFNMLNFVDQAVSMSGLEVETITSTERGSKFDLTCYVVDRATEFELLMVYNTMLFRRERIEELMTQFVFLLEQLVAAPNKNILAYSLVTQSAQQLLPDATESLDRTYHGSVPSALRRQAALQPNAVAVTDDKDQWSYEQLTTYSNRLSHYLISNGVKHGDVVVVYGHRNASLVWAVMGILGAGAAFVILDPAYPSNRLIDYMALAQPTAWLQISEAGDPPADVMASLDDLPLGCRLTLPGLSQVVATNMLSEHASDAPDVEIQADDLAYLSFTSGSTGRPKGVLGRHGSLTHFIPWQSETFNLSHTDRFSMLSGLAHDPLQRDMFTALWVGGTIVVPNPKNVVVPGWLGKWLREEGVTIAHLTPAMGQLIAESIGDHGERIESLRHAFFVGDVLSRRDVGRLCSYAPNLEVINFYGSTETQRAVGYFPVPPVEAHEILPAEERVKHGPMLKEIIPLGIGMPDSQLLVFNKKAEPAGVGEAGEVYMRSGHIALGYLGDPEMTAQRFLQNPATQGEDDLMYRTGDLGRYGPDGVVEFIGRADHQVKLRGYRIELGEIEASLGYYETVRDVVVLLREVGSSSQKEIVAFIVAEPGNQPEPADLRHFLKARLPDYMVPSQYVFIDELPLTPNRKIDRRQLLAMEITPMRRTQTRDGKASDELEEALIKLWEAELRVSPIGVHDNFFELGGHSLLGMSLFAKMESSLGYTLPASALFLAPTVRELADMIRRGEKGELLWSSLVPIRSEGRNKPFFYVSPFLISVLSLANLGNHLGEDQPLYGLQPQGLDGQGEIHTSIDEMAAHYISEMKTVQPTGPYHIGGHCSGNWVAFEIAQQLRAQGDEVASLVMVDSGPPNIERPPIKAASYIMSRLWLYIRSGRLKHAVVWQAKVLFGRFVLYRVGTEKSRQTEAVREAHRTAYAKYETEPYDGDILFIRSQESTQLRDKDWHLRWNEMVQGDVDIDVVSSTHANLLEEPFVEELAEKIRNYLPFGKK